jgi:hypothetical protein
MNSMKLAGRIALIVPLLLSSMAIQPQASAQGRQAATPTPAKHQRSQVAARRGGGLVWLAISAKLTPASGGRHHSVVQARPSTYYNREECAFTSEEGRPARPEAHTSLYGGQR